jgi:hypothetical protein
MIWIESSLIIARISMAGRQGGIQGENPERDASGAEACAYSIAFVPGINRRPTAGTSFH